MDNEAFIHEHLRDDVRLLLLRRAPEGVDLTWCAQQIEGYRTAQRKLPHWAATEGIHYPPRLSMEQCSSWETAQYKRQLLESRLTPDDRIRLVDMTGGLAVDFSAMAPLFHESIYIERLPHLCDLAAHNLPLLGLPRAEVVNTACPDAALWQRTDTVLFLDPARRDATGQKTVALADCTPNILELQPLWQKCKLIVVKLSPMLDIASTLRQVEGVSEVHAISVRGECKELLLIIAPGNASMARRIAANLSTDKMGHLQTACFSKTEGGTPQLAESVLPGGCLLFEPGASLLKTQLQDAFAQENGLAKVHPMSNLFITQEETLVQTLQAHGRIMRLVRQMDFSKKSLRGLRGMKQANLTLRNFPGTVDALRRQLKLKEGGPDYLFATTMADNSHALLHCHRI